LRIVALALAVPLALAPFSATSLAQNLVANPALVRDLPPPGWLADRQADWVGRHPVYQSTCRTADVAEEIEFLNRVVGRDENLLVLAGNPPQDNSPLAREAQLAHQEMSMLRNDIAATDGLVAQLQALPACASAAAAATSAKEAVAPAAAAPKFSAAPPPPSAPAKAAAQTVTLRYDDEVVALTPLGVRAFNQAVEAIHAGNPVRVAIEGCGSGADFSKGAACGERLRSLGALLVKNGIRNPKRLLASAP
jgi:hypothetical protein